jgi:hypothetical protein
MNIKRVREYGIVILPEPVCVQKAMSMNAKIASTLPPDAENVYNNWHITLYHGAYEIESLPEILAKLRNLDLRSFRLEFTLPLYITPNNEIFWQIVNTPRLQELHEDIVRIASPYHSRTLARSHDAYHTMDPKNKIQVNNYGVDGVLDLYNPHMTLFYKYPSNLDLKDILEPTCYPKIKETYNTSQIAIGELGYSGNVEKIIHSLEMTVNENA